MRVPLHAVTASFPSLSKRATSCVCEQLTDSAESKGLVERGVTRIVTRRNRATRTACTSGLHIQIILFGIFTGQQCEALLRVFFNGRTTCVDNGGPRLSFPKPYSESIRPTSSPRGGAVRAQSRRATLTAPKPLPLCGVRESPALVRKHVGEKAKCDRE